MTSEKDAGRGEVENKSARLLLSGRNRTHPYPATLRQATRHTSLPLPPRPLLPVQTEDKRRPSRAATPRSASHTSRVGRVAVGCQSRWERPACGASCQRPRPHLPGTRRREGGPPRSRHCTRRRPIAGVCRLLRTGLRPGLGRRCGRSQTGARRLRHQRGPSLARREAVGTACLARTGVGALQSSRRVQRGQRCHVAEGERGVRARARKLVVVHSARPCAVL